MAVKFILNISLMFSILAAPVFLAVAVWYRNHLGKAVFSWHIPEMVLVTIVYFITSLLLFIVGFSCFFSHWGFLGNLEMGSRLSEQFLLLGISCILLLSGMTMIYFGLRKILVQLVMEKGIIMNEKIVPLPQSLKLTRWDQIVDYYVVPDYPNAVFNFIVGEENLKYKRQSVKVPIFLKEDFQNFLEKQLYSAQADHADDSRISRPYFSEN
ncbi:MAG: hypothetical protein H6581_29015 [Bacteroidia bacterium]|nr:hypothetical protein [Bacteroidia bacterium]